MRYDANLKIYNKHTWLGIMLVFLNWFLFLFCFVCLSKNKCLKNKKQQQENNQQQQFKFKNREDWTFTSKHNRCIKKKINTKKINRLLFVD